MKAYPENNNLFRLVDDKKGECFHLKDKIKSLGGKWNGKNWIVPKEALPELKAIQMIKAIIDGHCCFKGESQVVFISKKDYDNKLTKVRWCSRCDSCSSAVVEVIKEA